MNFLSCAHIHLGNILYKYGWNHSLDNKFIFNFHEDELVTPAHVEIFVM